MKDFEYKKFLFSLYASNKTICNILKEIFKIDIANTKDAYEYFYKIVDICFNQLNLNDEQIEFLEEQLNIDILK